VAARRVPPLTSIEITSLMQLGVPTERHPYKELIMLHIHNGDSSANIARQSSLPGEHFAWREALIDGPTPAGIRGPEWLRLRAQHLTEFYGEDPGETETALRIQEEKLASYPEHDEVILWFEHDLFCQTNLIYCSTGSWNVITAIRSSA
jgi:hypothetical protein